jgi:hypothetical protein
MRHGWLMAFGMLLVVSACDKTAQEADKKEDADASAGISLSADQTKSLGIQTAPARAAHYIQGVSGFGVVTALDAIAQTDADFTTAAAAAAQSQAAAARAQGLATGDNAAVSREVVETAQSKAAADQAALALARRKTDAAFGMNAPWRDPAARQAIMARLASGQTLLVRVTFPLGAIAGEAPQNLRVSRLGAGTQSWTAARVWDAPADPAVPGRSVFALLDGSDLAQGERVTATIPVGAALSGVTVPADALILGESEASVYLQTKPNTYLRTKIDISRPMNNGYFVTSGVTPGQQVVTSGAGLLYAHEINPSTAAED